MNRKKIILFIVEGLNDQTNLSLILSKILITSEVQFMLTQGDITSDFSVNPQNIKSKIGQLINKFRGKIFMPTDFLEVVHLIDTDGTFITKDKVIYNESYKNCHYTNNEILTDNIDKIIDRNKRKVENLETLVSLNKACKIIPYSIYFFSCNMDHVFHGNANPTMEQKSQFATQFARTYCDDLKGFSEFLKERTCPKEDFASSWDFIKLDSNSLQSYTNFGLYLSNPKNKR